MSSVNLFSHLSGLRLSDGSSAGDRIRIASTPSLQPNTQLTFATLPLSVPSQNSSQHSSAVHSPRLEKNFTLQSKSSQEQTQLSLPYSSAIALSSNPTTATTTNCITTSTGSIQIFTGAAYSNNSGGSTNYLATATPLNGEPKHATGMTVSPIGQQQQQQQQQRVEDVAPSSADGTSNVIDMTSDRHRRANSNGSSGDEKDGSRTHVVAAASTSTNAGAPVPTTAAELATLSARSCAQLSSKMTSSVTSLLPFAANGLKLSPTSTISVTGGNHATVNYVNTNHTSSTNRENENIGSNQSDTTHNHSRTIIFREAAQKEGERAGSVMYSGSSTETAMNSSAVRTHDPTPTPAAGVVLASQRMPMSTVAGAATLTLSSGIDCTLSTVNMIAAGSVATATGTTGTGNNNNSSSSTLRTQVGSVVVKSTSADKLNPQVLQFFSNACSRQPSALTSPVVAAHPKELQSATVIATRTLEEPRMSTASSASPAVVVMSRVAQTPPLPPPSSSLSHVTAESRDEAEGRKGAHGHSHGREAKPLGKAGPAARSAAVSDDGSPAALTRNHKTSSAFAPPAPRSAKPAPKETTGNMSALMGAKEALVLSGPASVDVKVSSTAQTTMMRGKELSKGGHARAAGAGSNGAVAAGQATHERHHRSDAGDGATVGGSSAAAAPVTRAVTATLPDRRSSPSLKGPIVLSSPLQQAQKQPSLSLQQQQHQHVASGPVHPPSQHAATLSDAKKINQFIFDALDVGVIDNVTAKKPIICTLPKIPESGRYIIVGDVHGCVDQLEALVSKMNYVKGKDCLIVIGDFVNKGPDSIGVIRACQRLGALGVLGNHDYTLLKCCQRHHRRPFNQDEVRDPVKHLATVFPPDCEYYLRSLPHILRLPAYHVILVHAGLDFQCPLESQDIFDIMHMRRMARADEVATEAANKSALLPVVGDGKSKSGGSGSGNPPDSAACVGGRPQEKDGGGTSLSGAEAAAAGKYSVVVKGLAGKPWAEFWRGPEHVVFGHDAFAGFQSHPYAYGIDTGCVYGDPLTCVVYSKNSPKGEFYSVPGLSRHTNELLGLPPPNSDVYETLQNDLDRQIIRPTTRSTPAQQAAGGGGAPFAFLTHPVDYCSPTSVSNGYGVRSLIGGGAVSSGGTNGLAASRAPCTPGLTSIPVNSSVGSSKPAASSPVLRNEAGPYRATQTESVDEVQKATLLALSAAHELHSVSLLLAMPVYQDKVDAMLSKDTACQTVQQAFWLPFTQGILEAAHTAAGEWIKSNTTETFGEVSGYLEDVVMFALTICEAMDYVREEVQLQLKTLAGCGDDSANSTSLYGERRRGSSASNSQQVQWSRSVQKFIELLIK